VARESLRVLATVSVGSEVADHTSGGRTSVDGLGLVVVCTGTGASSCTASTRQSVGPDDTVVVVRCNGSDDIDRFEVRATSLDELQRGWNQLVLGAGVVT
jgi:hypothetical protein